MGEIMQLFYCWVDFFPWALKFFTLLHLLVIDSDS